MLPEEDQAPPWQDDEALPPSAGQAPPAGQAPAGQASADEGPAPDVKLGGFVHFVLPVGPYKGVDRLAVVSRVLDEEEGGGHGQADLHVFSLPGDHPNVSSTHLVKFAERVAYSKDRLPGTWHGLDEPRPGKGEGK